MDACFRINGRPLFITTNFIGIHIHVGSGTVLYEGAGNWNDVCLPWTQCYASVCHIGSLSFHSKYTVGNSTSVMWDLVLHHAGDHCVCYFCGVYVFSEMIQAKSTE